MDSKSVIRPWRGTVYRHIPASSPYGPLDTRFAAKSRENRWNAAGDPTLSFASDRGVIIGEFGRHFREDRSPGLSDAVRSRQIFAVELELERVVDLRDPATTQWLEVADAPMCFLDRTIARSTAGFFRSALQAEAILVPSVAFLDDPARWNLVLFLDRLHRSLDALVLRISEGGAFHVTPPGPP